ncbi:unnamed protein product [Auanema sp. JU1783]|nr:unnamed protein product [Auanema sp. JU1783]
MRILYLGFCVLATYGLVLGRPSEDSNEDDTSYEEGESKSLIPLPSKRALEMVGVKFIDALIKKGQVEMAKGAFKTQLDVLEKVNPKQFEKYKEMSVDELATDAVMQQAEMAKLQPKTGNPFVDMLNENGIPIASSLKGIEQAIKTQQEMENQDPAEQVAQAVFEKFQKQILPGLVANIIAGRNPFKMPQQPRPMQAPPSEIHRQALMMANYPTQSNVPSDNFIRRAPISDDSEVSLSELRAKLAESPRLRQLLMSDEVSSMLHARQHDEPIDVNWAERSSNRRYKDSDVPREEETAAGLDGKAAIVLGIHDVYSEKDVKESEYKENIRRAPLALSTDLLNTLQKNDELKKALTRMTYRVNDVEKYLAPKPLMINPKAQPGYFIPRKLPQRPRKMLPLLIGMASSEVEEIRRMPSSQRIEPRSSRVIQNLKNNPNIAPLFMDDFLEEKLTGRQVLTNEQKGKLRYKTIKAYPRLFSSKTLKPIDAKVTQMIEERPVPPLFWKPKGRHTRLRWTGATEKEIPGVGGRFILPSLDPTMPALNTAYSTQGRAREEWDSTFKIPNTWSPGDEAGFSVEHKSKRFVGGNAGVDMPAAGF